MISFRKVSTFGGLRILIKKPVYVTACTFSSHNGNDNVDDLIEKKFEEFRFKDKSKRYGRPPAHTDFIIIGGGAVGLSTAYWLQNANKDGYKVLVIEKDPTYSKSSTLTSRMGLRHTYGLKELVQMSKFSAEFFKDIQEYLSVPNVKPPNILFNHEGFLTLATESNKDILSESFDLQRSLGVQSEFLQKSDLEKQFPWLNVDDIAAASYGLQEQGWFDPLLLLAAYKLKCAHLGVDFFHGEVVGFDYMVMEMDMRKKGSVSGVKIRSPGGEVFRVECSVCINCAGPWASEVAKLVGIGSGEGHKSVEIPVEPRKRFLYVIHCPDGPGLKTPVVMDTSGVFLRREGLRGDYLCGANLSQEFSNIKGTSEQIGREFFEKFVGPAIVNRMPAFKNLEVTHICEGVYDHSYFDGSPIWGNHPDHRNFFTATGFNGEGPQLSPAIGRSFLEYIVKSEFNTINMSQFFMDRIYGERRIIDPTLMLTA